MEIMLKTVSHFLPELLKRSLAVLVLAANLQVALEHTVDLLTVQSIDEHVVL